MILAIDIGNTAISIAHIKGKRIAPIKTFDVNFPAIALKKKLRNYFKKLSGVEGVILCSVVPKVQKSVITVVQSVLKITPKVVGKDILVPIENRYDHPQQVGEDRLVGAYAVKKLYGYPAIIIDFGTAITFDVISATGAYEGGMIIPGIRLSAESLFSKTALLPRIEKIQSPRHLVGKNTKESILSGLFYGYGVMSKGLIDMIGKEIKGKPKVIVTGGYTKIMHRFIKKKITKFDSQLVFKGMQLLYKENNTC